MSPPPDGTRSLSLLSVVIPCFNEEPVLRETHRRLTAALGEVSGLDFEAIYVDDGSGDATLDVLRELQRVDQRVRVVSLSRNFGQQIALTAGMESAVGDAVVIMDADLQDPPEVIPEMLDRWRQGVDIVHGQRNKREGETWFKLWTARVFNRLFNRLSKAPLAPSTGEFRMMDRAVVDALRIMPEHQRFLRGMTTWVGFRQDAVPYRRAARFKGETKYPLKKMIGLAADGIFSFSVVPLRLCIWSGFLASALALAGIVYALVVRLSTDAWVSGWAMLFVAVLFVGGVQLLFLGIIGEYLGRIYIEVKRRPLYVVRERLGFAPAGGADGRDCGAST